MKGVQCYELFGGIALQHSSDIGRCSTAVAVIEQTCYAKGASYFDRKPMK